MTKLLSVRGLPVPVSNGWTNMLRAKVQRSPTERSPAWQTIVISMRASKIRSSAPGLKKYNSAWCGGDGVAE